MLFGPSVIFSAPAARDFDFFGFGFLDMYTWCTPIFRAYTTPGVRPSDVTLDIRYTPCTFLAMQLATYMEQHGLTDDAFGARIGKSRVTVSRYRRKLEIPSSETVKLIVDATSGKVSANELLDIEVAEAHP